jgi:hypoxanthine phosphoribosyltransferase
MMKVINNFKEVIHVPLQGACVSPKDLESIRPQMKNRIERTLITRKLIHKRVKALAREIAKYYKSQPRIEMLFILEGASIFAHDLAREIYNCGGPEIRPQSIKASTYGTGIKAAGETDRSVKIIYFPSALEGKSLLLVEDIVDQGFTLHAVRNWLFTETRALEVKICALIEKNLDAPSPEVRKLRDNLKLDWVGFTIPDQWVAGYGIDVGDDFRFLPFVAIAREEYYKQRQGG